VLISLNWIQQYLPTIDQVDALDVADRISNSLAEVERVYKIGDGVNNIVVGEVISAELHPKSKTLQVCQIRTGENEVRQIIHGGGLMVKAGDKVVVC